MFLLLILYASYTDYTRREIPNSIILCIYVLSLASNNLIFERITGFLIPALPLFFIALKYDGIKGGCQILISGRSVFGIVQSCIGAYSDNRNGGRVELCEVREKRSACNCILYRIHNL